jgi:putative CocE/NonD family hydrolase
MNPGLALITSIFFRPRFLFLLIASLAVTFFSIQSSAQTPIQASGPLITTESNLMVTMRDGVNIALDIYRPAQRGTYPTLYSSAPYPHIDDSTPPDNAALGSVAWFVSQGFNYVIASVRGTGMSEGDYEFLSREEQQDHYEIIEWIAEQSWSDGQVLGIGSDYYATAQWQMAIQNPPSLKCIAPVNGLTQPYQDWAFPGGIANAEFLQDWYENKVRRANAFADPASPTLVNYDLRLQMLAHPFYDDYWQIRSSLPNVEAINIPVFIADSWQDGMALTSNFAALKRLNSIHKMAVFGGSALLQDSAFLQQHLLPYYRWCLQDENATDFTALPELRYQNQETTVWQTLTDWPPTDISHAPLYLNRQDLDTTVPATLDLEIQQNNIAVSRYGLLDEGADIDNLTFISKPLANDLEIVGPIMFELYASSSETDTAFEISLFEEINLEQVASSLSLPGFLMNVIETAADNAQGTTLVPISTGRLKASMRAYSEGSNTEYQPSYLFTSAQPLTPSRTTRMDVAMQPIAHRFRAGSKIIMRIRQISDDSLAEISRQDSIYHSQRSPSRIWLPVLSGELAMTEPLPEPTVEEDLRDIPVDIQSELIPDPATGFRFDTEFSSELNNGELSDTLMEASENPVLFIRPQTTTEATE